MTGYGEAHRQADGVTAAVEVRTINSRYFKLSVRCAEGYSALETEIESVVRQQIKRGTLQVNLRIDRPRSPDQFRINIAVLEGFKAQLDAVRAQWRDTTPLSLDKLLLLPGVVDESAAGESAAAEDWPLIRATLEAALANLAQMRANEGRAMSADLKANAATIARELGQISARAPMVVDAYRGRLQERVAAMLAEYQVTLQPGDLIREVGIYAERSDISEEIVRLQSHLEQFDATMELEDSVGRKLEFVVQEMGREVNTIGSKSNDTQISKHVIEIKSAIEKIREMIQNVE
jgi:uncharacterized protein (TIGR00255 family)